MNEIQLPVIMDKMKMNVSATSPDILKRELGRFSRFLF